jgi:hypothetical protein
MQANIKDSSLLEVTLDAFALYIIFHLFDLTSLERRYMLRDSWPMGLEDASCSRVWIWLEVAALDGVSVLLPLALNTRVLNLHDLPLRPVAPEQASRASKITIDGRERLWRSLSSIRWCAIAAPAYPAPIITISALEGSNSVDRCLSIGLVPFLQNDLVEYAVGNGPGDVCFGAMFCYYSYQRTREQSCHWDKLLNSGRFRFV